MKVDLHVHSSNRSLCGNADEEEIIQTAISQGLDAIAFTDHNVLVPDTRLIELNIKYAPFSIIAGIEVSIGMEHVVVLGIHDKGLEKNDWEYPKLHAFCRKNQGFIFLAHPFRFNPQIEIDVNAYPPDALEIYSTNTPPHVKPMIDILAAKLQITKLSNSDAHRTEFIGKYYNILDSHPHTESKMFSLLRKGKFTRAALDRGF